MHNKKNFLLAVEKGYRVLEKETVFFHFFMVEFKIPKKEISHNVEYSLNLFDKKLNPLYTKKIKIDTHKKCIITKESHEDPLVETKTHYHICFQIDYHVLSTLSKECTITLTGKNKILLNEKINNLSAFAHQYKEDTYSKINNNCIVSEKKCTLTYHLGDKQGQYTEKTKPLDAGKSDDFSHLIKEYSYIGVQCSYDDENPEIEEKHIIVGQKGIFLSGYFYHEKEKIMPPIAFNEKYQEEYKIENFKEVSNIQELLNFYHNKKPRTFESQTNFLLPGYLANPTYNQDYLYSAKKIRTKHHLLSNTCKNCQLSAKCLQVVPSGLSPELFNETLKIDNPQNCRIYQLIEK